MKKFLCIMLAMIMVLSLAACGSQTAAPAAAPAAEAPAAEAPAAEAPAAEAPVEEAPAEEAPAEEVPEVVEEAAPAEVSYEPLELNFKNKTGVTITGLYLYESGSEDKGHSLCLVEWPCKDESDLYEFNALVYRNAAAPMDLYVTFADGTDATWEGLTVSNYDKLSLKGGVDPAEWEQEPVDDPEDIALMDEIAAAGRTADGFYPGYKTLGLELKNKTEKNIVEMYIYETGGSADAYPEIIALNVEGGVWEPGKGGFYMFGYFVRPVADTYEMKVVFDDGSELIVPDIDLTTPDLDGHPNNEISLKDAVDPDLEKIQYDDGDPEPLAYISDAITQNMPLDGWLPISK